MIELVNSQTMLHTLLTDITENRSAAAAAAKPDQKRDAVPNRDGDLALATALVILRQTGTAVQVGSVIDVRV